MAGKKEITTLSDGISIVKQLRPVTFKWKPHSDIPEHFPDYDPEDTERKRDNKMYGLIAQEVKVAMDKHNMDNFSGWKERSNRLDKEKTQQISKEAFVIPLIKAMQELSTKVDALTARVTTLEG